jgi:hypothetical protein
LGLAVATALGLLVLGWEWSVGLGWGFAAVGAGRLVRWGFLKVLVREGRGGVAAGLSGLARQLFLSLVAVGGILAGLPPLAVAGGLLVPTVGRWIWTVRLARTPG